MHKATFSYNLRRRTRTRPAHMCAAHASKNLARMLITYFVNHQITPDWLVYRIIIVICRDFSVFDKMLRNAIKMLLRMFIHGDVVRYVNKRLFE